MMRMPPSSTPPPRDILSASAIEFRGVRSSSVEPDLPLMSFRPRLSSLPPGGIADAVDGEWLPRSDPNRPSSSQNEAAFFASGVAGGLEGQPRRKRRPRSVAEPPQFIEGPPLPPLGKMKGNPGGAATMNPQRPKPPLPSYFPSSPTTDPNAEEIRLFTPSPRLVINSGNNSNNSPDVLSPSAAPFRVIVGGGGGSNGVSPPEIEFPEMILLTGGGGGSTATRTSQLIDAASRSLSHSSSSIGSSVEMTTSSSSSVTASKHAPPPPPSNINNDGNANNVNNNPGNNNDKRVFEHRLTSQLSFSEKAEQYGAAMTASVSVLRGAVTRKQQLDALEEMRATVNSAKGEGIAGRGGEIRDVVCDALRRGGGLELLIQKIATKSEDQQPQQQQNQQFYQRQRGGGGGAGPTTYVRSVSVDDTELASASVLEQTLSSRNRDHVVASGLEGPILRFSVKRGNVGVARIGTGLLAQLFKHSEDSCHRAIKRGGLEAIVERCASNDPETQRQCAIAFANLAMYGGPDSKQKMIQQNVPDWLFTLAFSLDPLTKYYACLAICALVSDKQFEAAVLKSGTLGLVDPFVATHDPVEFALHDDLHHGDGQSTAWLERLLPVLESSNPEAQKLAAFHFAMEAFLKVRGGKLSVLRDIGVPAALKRVASCPNDVASKLARKGLKLMDEDVPHRLSQQVPLWATHDVYYWVKHVLNLCEYATRFRDCHVDGDLLLQITEESLIHDLEMTNGLHRKLFMRQLTRLKQQCDYSSCDYGRMFTWLATFQVPLTHYTYDFVLNGVSRYDLPLLADDNLKNDMGINNSIHRRAILDAVAARESQQSGVCFGDEGQILNKSAINKSIDAFISYRRSNGSQLASLLKVHLQLRNFSVFLDVVELEAGKFDENLLLSVRAAKNFILVLTPNALDRCMGDYDQNDWVHKEIFTALQSGCNIIPITDNFAWPQAETLPVDIQKVCRYNGINWIHDYQDACIAKIVRFIKGEAGGNPTIAASAASDIST